MDIHIIFVTVIIVVAYSGADTPPDCPSPFATLRHQDTCSKWWQCSWGKAIPKSCPSALVWSKALGVCVSPHDSHNDCTLTSTVAPLTIAERCAHGEKFIPHPTQCAQFYNCSLIRTLGGPTNFPEQHLDECEYPYLFDSVLLQCTWFNFVKCEKRHEPLDASEYRAYGCPRSHCRPAYEDFPSCKNKPDGVQEYTGREGLGQFIFCEGQRFIASQQCPFGLLFLGTTKTCFRPRRSI